jgi:multidrug resistance protein
MTVLFIGVFMAALDTAVIAPAIPALRETFGVDNRRVGLVMIAFILSSLCSTAPLANLGDRYGRRPIYMLSIALFALGSLVIALAPTFWTLVAGRAIQGMGGGGIIPTASAVIADVLPPKERGRALGLIGATYGMAFVLGPPLAGVVMVTLSWHWIFLANLPIAAYVLYLGARALPTRRTTATTAPLDWRGIVLLFLLLTSFVLGLTRVLDDLTGLVFWPGMLLAVVVLMPLFLTVEKRAAQPMIPLSIFANRQLSLAYFLTFGAGFGMGSVVFLTSIATSAYGIARANAGFVLLPLVLCSIAGSMGSGRLLNRIGARVLIISGFALLGVGYGATAYTGFGLWGYLVTTMPIGLGVGVLVSGALRTIAIDEAPLALRGAAQGLINIFTSVGTLLAATAIGALADYNGGGTTGFSIAYVFVSVLMTGMLFVSLGLRQGAATPLAPVEA